MGDKKIIALAIALFMCAIVHAQDKFWKSITIRKAYESGTPDDQLPAVFSLTLPKNSKDSYLINGGVGYGFDRNRKLHSDLTAFFVYNRNTLTDLEQKNYKLGLSSNHSFDLNRAPSLAIFGTSTLQYLHDYIDDAHSLIVTSYWQPLYKSSGNIHVGGYVLSDHVVNYFFSPQLGAEHQQILAAGGAGGKGFDFRGYFSAGGSVVFKRKTYYSTAELREDLTRKLLREDAWKKRTASDLRDTINQEIPDEKKVVMEKRYWTRLIECNVSYAGRLSLIHHNSGFENYIPLFTAMLTAYPVKNDNFSVSFSYNDGANPIDGTLKQTFWLLSLNFRK